MAPHVPRRVIVRISPGNQCIIGINPDWAPVHTLAHILDMLASACGHHFRGVWFPPCAGHEHPAQVDEADGTVILRCPDTGRVAFQLHPNPE